MILKATAFGCPIWAYLVLGYLCETCLSKPVLNLEGVQWMSSPSWYAIISIAVALTAAIALACCSCQACQSKGKVKPQQYYEHTHKIRQAAYEHRKEDPVNLKELATKLCQVGVTAATAAEYLDSDEKLRQFGVTKERLDQAGGKDQLIHYLISAQRRLETGTSVDKTSMSGRNDSNIEPLPSAPAIRVPLPTSSRDTSSKAKLDSFSSYVADTRDAEYTYSKQAEQPRASQPRATTRPAFVIEPSSSTSPSARTPPRPQPNQLYAPSRPARQTLSKKATPNTFIVPKGKGGGIDEKADFDYMSIYDMGELNEYGLIKSEREQLMETAVGLDKRADFDEYTIYGGGVTDEQKIGSDIQPHAFDEYTIYDQGQLNEYGVLKAQREQALNRMAGSEQTYGFDDYTIYQQGELNTYGVLKAEREMKRDAGQETEAKVDYSNIPYENRPLPKPPTVKYL